MANIRIERVPIQAMNLGKLRGDHLMLVYQQDPLDYGYYQDLWWVMEGTRDTNPDGSVTLGVDGADGITTLSQANGGKTAEELLDAIRYPSWRGSKIIPSLDPFGDWNLMATVARNIDSALYPYFAFNFALNPLPTVNSSSVIASLLYYIGVDIAENMPDTFLTFTVGTRTLLGTSQDDQLQMEGSLNTILAGEGADTIAGADEPNQYEKLYGGSGDDILVWSEGSHVYHGGQPELDYAEDGLDAVEYTGIGTVRIEAVEGSVPHLVADYVAIHATGTDRLFSIEKIRWNPTSDNVLLGEGVQFGGTRLLFELGDESPDSQGDTLDFTDQSSGLLVAPSDRDDIVLVGSALPDGVSFSDQGGIWAQSLEWIVGSAGADRIYAGGGLVGVEGGEGDDLLSGRLVEPLQGSSPQGYDLELSGGAGNDILVSGTGRSLAAGGDGDDIFVLSALSRTDRLVEFVIADASTTDRLYVPYNFLKPDSAGFEGSELFPVLGGVTSIAGQTGFADLPQHAGPGPHGLLDLEGVAYLLFRTQQEQIFTPDATTGIVDIAGQIYFNRDGDDLLIHVFEGFAFEGTYFNSFGEPYQYTDVLYFADSEAVIRVVDFQDGMLGIDFYDLGNSTPFDFTNYAGPGSTELYENWDTIAQTLTNNGVLTSALPAEPDTPAFDLPADGQPDAREQLEGTEGDDLIIASAPVGAVQATAEDAAFSSGSDLSGGAGNDTLVGSSGRDRLDGGTGSDTMSGGGGNDLYLVDSAGDVVNESANGGLDTVAASLSYVLTANVENLNLTGAAVEGQGNTLANKINGTTAANVLAGFGGDDTLYGAAGDDLLDGGEGNDVIVYMIGDGSDTIADTGTEGDLDVLKLVGFETLDVGLFISAANSDDALLRFADGERATLLSFFTGQSIDSIQFDDGTVWDRSFITSQAIASGALLNDAPIAGSDEGFFTHLGDIVIPKADLLANDRDSDGDSLEIVAAASETPGATAVVTSEGDLRLTVAPGQTGAVLFTYTLSDGRGGLSTGRGDITFIANAAPILSTAPPADQSIEAGEMWAFSLPIETFADPDGHSMVYTADLSDGSSLPDWLTYDAATRTFEGTPPPDFAGELEIRITASDSVASTSATFRLTITDGGGGGTPTIIGTSGRDRLTGTDGHDIFDAMGGNDRMDGRDGDDIFLAAGEAGFDTYIGGAGLDAIQGSAGDDVIGIAGQTGLLSGIESIDGGAGFNILRLTTGSNILDLSDVTVANINLIDAGGGHDTVIGSAGDDVIMAGGGRDQLFGNGGNDTFQFAIHSGRDTYNGGSGFDTILGSSGDDILRLDNGSADLVSIEAIALGDGLDSIRLGPGDDVLDLSSIAVSGVDRIQAGAGNDRIVASFADDTLYGGAGQDTFVFREGFGNDTIADFRISRGGTRPSDSIDLSDLDFGTIIDVFINAQQIGADTVITDPDSGSTLTLSRIQLAQLSAADFIL